MTRLFLIVIFLGASVIVALFYLSPEWDRFKELRSDVIELEDLSAEMDALTLKRDELLQAINSIPKQDLDRIQQAIPKGSRPSQILTTLEGFARGRGISILSIDLATPEEAQASAQPGQPRPGGVVIAAKPAGALQEILIAFNLAGSYSAFKGFLADLERSLRIMDVQDVSFQAGEIQSGAEPVFRYNLKVKAYYQ